MADAAGGVEQGSRKRARRGLPPAFAVETLGLSRGYRRSGLLFRLGSVLQEHRQYPPRRRRQCDPLHTLSPALSASSGDRSAWSERRMTKSALLTARARGLKVHEPLLFRGRGRRKRVGGDRDWARLPAEAPPSHADVAK